MTEAMKKVVGSKQRILEAAVREFADYGLEGARVDRIAKNAKINKAMIYYHFASKEKLYRRTIEDFLKKIARLVEGRIEKVDNVEDFLLYAARSYHEMVNLEKGYGRIMLREIASGSKLFPDIFADALSKRGIPGKLKQLIEGGIREGRFRKIDSRQAMISFIGMNLFYLILSPLVNQVWEIKDEAKFKNERPEIVVDLFMRGLEVR